MIVPRNYLAISIFSRRQVRHQMFKEGTGPQTAQEMVTQQPKCVFPQAVYSVVCITSHTTSLGPYGQSYLAFFSTRVTA